MVNEDAWNGSLHDVLLKTRKAAGLVEVAGNDEVGLCDGRLNLFLMFLVCLNEDAVSSRQPFEEVGEDIWYDDGCLFALPLKVVLQSK